MSPRNKPSNSRGSGRYKSGKNKNPESGSIRRSIPGLRKKVIASAAILAITTTVLANTSSIATTLSKAWDWLFPAPSDIQISYARVFGAGQLPAVLRSAEKPDKKQSLYEDLLLGEEEQRSYESYPFWDSILLKNVLSAFVVPNGEALITALRDRDKRLDYSFGSYYTDNGEGGSAYDLLFSCYYSETDETDAASIPCDAGPEGRKVAEQRYGAKALVAYDLWAEQKDVDVDRVRESQKIGYLFLVIDNRDKQSISDLELEYAQIHQNCRMSEKPVRLTIEALALQTPGIEAFWHGDDAAHGKYNDPATTFIYESFPQDELTSRLKRSHNTTKKLPSLPPGKSALWLSAAYIANEEGYEKNYLCSVLIPKRLTYEDQKGNTHSLAIRAPLREEAMAIFMPGGWYMQ